MESLAELIATLPSEDLVCITPEKRVRRRELLLSAMHLRENGAALADPLVGGYDVASALQRIIALDGYASALFLVPADADERVQMKVRALANRVTLLEPGGETQWIMATSGTTGAPKLVSHNLRSLTRSLKINSQIGSKIRWALLYDPCRFAGLQVTLQACISGSILLVPDSKDNEVIVDFLKRENCTSISATPSMWRKLLSTTGAKKLNLHQVTLGGEIADQKTLQRLRLRFPEAKITHIYASTEAGVGFSVKDGLEGFPSEYLEKLPGGKVELKIAADGLLLIRGANFNQSYVGQPEALINQNGFINTGDVVELRGNRVFFLGRANGSINVGGQKVMPEEVEAVLRGSQNILDAKVYGKPSPVLGSVVVAEVVPLEGCEDVELKKQLQALCQSRLEAFKRPAVIRIVSDIELTGAGKMMRIAK
jgi:acyl-CoA synthetase (AMP-forming)/AMP-acid ligase II